MTITTYSAFATALSGLSVTGVTKAYTEPPASIPSADLPASWPGLPRGNEHAVTFAGGGGWAEVTCDLVVAVEAVGQNTLSANYTATMTIIDALTTALRAASIGRSKLSWAISANVQIMVSDTPYWAVIASVTGSL